MRQRILEKLNQEIKAIRSFIIGILGKDREGEYKPEFVRKVLKAARKKATLTFKNKEAFLKQIKKNYNSWFS